MTGPGASPEAWRSAAGPHPGGGRGGEPRPRRAPPTPALGAPAPPGGRRRGSRRGGRARPTRPGARGPRHVRWTPPTPYPEAPGCGARRGGKQAAAAGQGQDLRGLGRAGMFLQPPRAVERPGTPPRRLSCLPLALALRSFAPPPEPLTLLFIFAVLTAVRPSPWLL